MGSMHMASTATPAVTYRKSDLEDTARKKTIRRKRGESSFLLRASSDTQGESELVSSFLQHLACKNLLFTTQTGSFSNKDPCISGMVATFHASLPKRRFSSGKAQVSSSRLFLKDRARIGRRQGFV